MTPNPDQTGHPSELVDGLSLSAYVDVCRSLIRDGGGSTHRIEAVLAGYGLTQLRWAQVSAAWTNRIRASSDLRAEFQRLYVGPAGETRAGNE